MSKVKICGIKRIDEVMAINEFPVSYAGFIFAPSKRLVTIEQCINLKNNLRDDIKTVGVFVDAPLSYVLEAIERCELDIIQLHGEESVDYIQQIPRPVWKTISVKDKFSLEKIAEYVDVVDGILLETHHKDLKGGTGKSFDWSLVEYLSVKNNQGEALPIILAGGLKPENVEQASLQVRPAILDVNSGVEIDGIKSYGRIKALFQAL